MAKKLPLGLQDFREIIVGGYKYIDKTEYVHQMCTTGKYYFLSRPRRFGKSITLAVLQELYLGSQELFKGMWIEDKWDWSKKHPVIRLSFTSLGFQQNGLVESLTYELDRQIREKGFSPVDGNITNKFSYLITQLAAIHKVVVLIDEYDAPIVHYLGKEIQQAYDNRELLKGFYTVLKDLDPYLEFVFITGVSKFSKVGVFSGLNNLTDLTMHPQYATMLGYTQEELEQNFVEELAAAGQKLQLTPEELLHKLRWWYNGYRFEEDAQTVYNPVSINNFFRLQKFENFWFETGTPSFLINLLKQARLYNFRLVPQGQQSFDTFDLEDLNIYGLLYQTGYLTIKSRNAFGLYELDYPNHEVEHAMNGYLLEAFGGMRKGDALPLIFKLETFFQQQKLDEVMHTLQGMFKTIPYSLHEKYPEKFFHAAIHLLFTYMGVTVHSEVCTSDGRIDALVETDTHIYIFEFKLDESAEVALTQIRQKQYYQAFWLKGKPLVGVGVNVSSATKNINGWQMEELKKI
jgi:hypothetical protein